ncbi:hypothetical protein GCM10020295_75470 [Streptomyces cinereospinus]
MVSQTARQAMMRRINFLQGVTACGIPGAARRAAVATPGGWYGKSGSHTGGGPAALAGGSDPGRWEGT